MNRKQLGATRHAHRRAYLVAGLAEVESFHLGCIVLGKVADASPLRLRPLQLLQPHPNRHGLRRREVLAFGVLVTFGLEQVQRCRQTVGSAGRVALALPALLAFLAIGAGAALLILAWAPTLSPARQVAFLGSLFALSGAVVVAVVVWAAGRR